MKLVRSIVAAALGAVLVACATPNVPPARSVAVSNPHGLQCHTERITGSMIDTRVCTTPAQREAMGIQTRSMQNTLNQQQIATCPGSPGCGH
jgi:hypothetical protein